MLCPRKCGVDREKKRGFCGETATVRVARAALHKWEEPVISGTNGSGTVFFTGCAMRCVFCQNYEISQQGKGMEITVQRLAEIFLELKEQGAHNINLVNPTHFVPQIIAALDIVKDRLNIPVVYNSGGYERVETLEKLNGYVDIYLPDLKYYSDELAREYSSAPDYFIYASAAVKEMQRQTGTPVIENGLMKKGTIVRHLILPGSYKDSLKIMEWVRDNFSLGEVLVSIMSQYVPCFKATDRKPLSRRLTTFENDKVIGFAADNGILGFMQERSSATKEYTPDFDFSGIV